MLLLDSVERNRHFINLGAGKPDFPTLTLLRIDKNFRNHFAVQVFVEIVDGNLDDVFVFHFASRDVRDCAAGLERSVVLSALPGIHTAPVSQAQKHWRTYHVVFREL